MNCSGTLLAYMYKHFYVLIFFLFRDFVRFKKKKNMHFNCFMDCSCSCEYELNILYTYGGFCDK